MDTELTITTERIDDFVLLLQVMMRLGLPAILDRHIPRHWLQEGLSWGWVTTIWLAHILSQGDLRKLPVRDWAQQAHTALEQTTGLPIRDTDFTDDRLTLVLRMLSRPKYWQAIELELGQTIVRVYDLPTECVRGETGQAMPAWIQAALDPQKTLTPINDPAAAPGAEPIATGYEWTRPCQAQVNGQDLAWEERVLVVHSAAYAEVMTRGLERRLAMATAKLQALTPARGPGKRQITEETALVTAAQAILAHYRVLQLLSRHTVLGRIRMVGLH
jgi:transposase